MNYLQLCKEVARDSGTVAGALNITTLAGATGRVAKVAAWVRDAWIDIQNERQDWRFLRHRFASKLVVGQQCYCTSDLGIIGAWLPDVGHRRLMTVYEMGQKERESEIAQIDYDDWSERYYRGVHDQNRPVHWAISPQNDLLIGPTPDKEYVIAGEFRRAAQVLEMDDDVPQMPEAYHRVIVAEALRLMARSDEAYQMLAEKAQLYDRLRNPLINDQTPPMTFGGGTFA